MDHSNHSNHSNHTNDSRLSPGFSRTDDFGKLDDSGEFEELDKFKGFDGSDEFIGFKESDGVNPLGESNECNDSNKLNESSVLNELNALSELKELDESNGLNELCDSCELNELSESNELQGLKGSSIELNGSSIQDGGNDLSEFGKSGSECAWESENDLNIPRDARGTERDECCRGYVRTREAADVPLHVLLREMINQVFGRHSSKSLAETSNAASESPSDPLTERCANRTGDGDSLIDSPNQPRGMRRLTTILEASNESRSGRRTGNLFDWSESSGNFETTNRHGEARGLARDSLVRARGESREHFQLFP